MNIVVGVEEIFSYCQKVLRNMGLSEIRLFHPSHSMSYQDFQRIYGQGDQEETHFQEKIIGCIADVIAVYGQGLARDIFLAYIEDSERIDSVVFEDHDYVVFKKEISKFLYITYASFYSQQQQIHPQKSEIIQYQIVDISVQPPEVNFQLNNIQTLQKETIQTKSKVQLIQIVEGLDIQISPIRPFVHIKEDFVQQMLYGQEIFMCHYLNTQNEMACFMKFFPTLETAQKGFTSELISEKGQLRNCAIQHDGFECFNSLLQEDMTIYKKRTMGGILEIYSYQYLATVAFRKSSHPHHVGQIFGWFDDRGMHWKKDISDHNMIQEMSRVLRNLDAEIGCRPQKPSRRRRR